MADFDYDLFVSHASEDKETFVRPLVEALEAEHLSVWYDESKSVLVIVSSSRSSGV